MRVFDLVWCPKYGLTNHEGSDMEGGRICGPLLLAASARRLSSKGKLEFFSVKVNKDFGNKDYHKFQP